mmetsp:Transcript_41578/g.120385  ORF Transcript_41578/g.120385 Transcript_41578/m.120385 type:complete len:81 (-) Transcript_41578:818-1060(-)
MLLPVNALNATAPPTLGCLPALTDSAIKKSSGQDVHYLPREDLCKGTLGDVCEPLRIPAGIDILSGCAFMELLAVGSVAK